VLPRTEYGQGGGGGGGYPGQPASPGKFDGSYMLADSEEKIDPKMRRQAEHSSELFGRDTPAALHDQVHDNSRRLTPSDFKWFSVPEKVSPQGGQEDVTHAHRRYHEKCSQLFDRSSPNMEERDGHRGHEKTDKEEEDMGDAKRRANVYYSDLFGRGTPMDMPEHVENQYHPKHHGNPEDRITVHQDWTDSKTELVCGSRPGAPATPITRKTCELHQARIFGRDQQYAAHEELEPVTMDNSYKVKNAFGLHTQQIHQAHLRTSMTDPQFYEDASNTKHWEVVELHISGLSMHADENQVRALCTGFDLQIVKVSVEMDPVRNLCKGRAKIMVRYNPKRDSISNLVQKLEQTKLTVGL
jgi:hypothetical protein